MMVVGDLENVLSCLKHLSWLELKKCPPVLNIDCFVGPENVSASVLVILARGA
jgi:hypothetical protein